MSKGGFDDPFPVADHDDDLACDQCGRQLCDGACQIRDPRPQPFDPKPFRIAVSDSDDDNIAVWKPDFTQSAKSPKQLPFETRYFEKPRLLSKSSADPAIVFFRTQPSTPSTSTDIDLETGLFPIPDSVTPPARRQRRRHRRHRRAKSESDTTETMRTAAAHWSAGRDPEAVWYSDPLATQRTRQSTRQNANGALRSSACRAMQCFLVMSAAMSVIILIAIGATMILTTSIG